MDPRLDAVARQRLPHGVAMSRTYHVEMPDGLHVTGGDGRDHIYAPQQLPVERGMAAAPLRPLVQTPQLDAQERRLERVQAPVEALHDVDVLLPLAVVAQHANRVPESGVAGHDRAAVAERPEVLRLVEAEGRRVPERAGTAAPVAGAMSLACVLDDEEA